MVRRVGAVVTAAVLGCVLLGTGAVGLDRTGRGLAADGADREPSSRVEGDIPLGISTGFGILDLPADQLHADLDAVVRLGAERIRVDLSWATVEPTRGTYDWSAPDRVFSAAQARGLHVLAILGYRPDWGQRTDGSVDRAGFARFAAAAARRYHGLVDSWEIWNEPNLQQSWVSAPDPVAYAGLVEAVAPPLRRHDPGARILVGSLAPAVDAEDGSGMSPSTFLRRMYESGVDRRSFDAVSVHPYSYPAMPGGRQSWNTFHRLPDLHELMRRAGDGAKRLVLTEYGAPTGRSERAVGPRRQATMLLAAYRVAEDLPYVGSIYVYSLRDAARVPGDPEANFGLLTHDGRTKPAFHHLRRELAGSR